VIAPAADTTVRGREAEALACQYLTEQGLRISMRNYRCARGEIDLIMRDGDTVVFVEVRFRRSSRFGGGAESVDRRKQSRLIETASHYLQAHGVGPEMPARFDVVALSPGDDRQIIEWIPNAFQA
jgi:putative endonuclease